MTDKTLEALKQLEELHRPRKVTVKSPRPKHDPRYDWRRDKIEKWWGERLAEGAQLEARDEFIRGYHYTVNTPDHGWLRDVSWLALRRDYSMSTEDYWTTEGQFVVAFTRLAGANLVIRKLTRPPRTDGRRPGARRIDIKESVAYVRFGPLETYSQRFIEATARDQLTQPVKRGNIESIASINRKW